MNHLPLVSIIVACYNAENYIDGCLESLVNQSYSNLEIIICDDCSTDSSWDKLLKWKNKDIRISILRNQENRFAAYTRNRCIEKAKGDYIAVQDIDDYSRYDRIEFLVNSFDNDNVDFISSSMAAFDQDPNIIFTILKQKHARPEKHHFLWNLPFFHPSTIFKKECINSVHGYRVAPETRRGQDYDMFMRMYAEGYKGKNIDEPLYIFRLDQANIKRRTFDARIGEFKIRLRGFSKLGMMPWAAPFIVKPFVAHIVQKIKYWRI